MLAAQDGSAFVHARLAKLSELERRFMEEQGVQIPDVDDMPPSIADTEGYGRN